MSWAAEKPKPNKQKALIYRKTVHIGNSLDWESNTLLAYFKSVMQHYGKIQQEEIQSLGTGKNLIIQWYLLKGVPLLHELSLLEKGSNMEKKVSQQSILNRWKETVLHLETQRLCTSMLLTLTASCITFKSTLQGSTQNPWKGLSEVPRYLAFTTRSSLRKASSCTRTC